MRHVRWSALCLGLVMCTGAIAHAQATPQVTSFTANPSTINHDYTTLLSWTTDASSAVRIYISCPVGVTAKTDGGTVIPCNSWQPLSTASVGSLGLMLSNVSGTAKTVHLDLMPVDVDGNPYPAGEESSSVTVNTSVRPIVDFSSSSALVSTGDPVTLSWTSYDITGVNMQFRCPGTIHITGTSPSGDIPCAGLAYSTDQPISGSVGITFANDDIATGDVSVDILPAMAPGVYDGLHEQTLTIHVGGKIVTPPPSVTAFTASTHTPGSGQPVTLSWSVQNAAGANLQFNCDSALRFSTVQGTTTSPLPCGTPAFTTAFATSGSATIAITNVDTSAHSASVWLFPQNSDGTYDGIRSASFNLVVSPPGAVQRVSPPAVPATTAAPTATATTTAPTPAAGSIRAVHPVTFSVALQRGSRGAQVTALQTFLALDPSLYPEAAVTGYFGPATERAVQKFQIRYGIAQPGAQGYGTVGPKTRVKLNGLQYF